MRKGVNTLKFPSFYVTVTKEKLFFVDSLDYDSTQTYFMELFGEQYRLRSRVKLTPHTLPTLMNFYSDRVAKVEINDATFGRHIAVVYQILEIRGRKYAGLRQHRFGLNLRHPSRVCNGCASCIYKNCDFAPIFRVPNWFDCPRYEFYYSSSKFMPNPEEIRCYEKVFPLGSKWSKYDVSFRSCNKQVTHQSDFMDIVEVKTIRDVAEYHFAGIYSRFSLNLKELITRAFVDYPMCGKVAQYNYRAVVTQKLMGLSFLPCGRRVFFFSIGGHERRHPVDAMCNNNVAVTTYGAGTFVIIGFSGGFEIATKQKALIKEKVLSGYSMLISDYDAINEDDFMNIVQ